MVVFPNCKINIGLNITSRRSDGFHNLETVFYPIHWTDVLEVTNNNGLSPALYSSGIHIYGKASDNICLKAYYLLKQDFPQLPFIDIYLHKAIATGAGLGGGSADGAFMLMLLNKKFSLNLTDTQLIGYCLQLGSDCPFFILNKPCFATGRGEEMTPLDIHLSGYLVVLVNPGIHVNTRLAFSKITPAIPAKSVRDIILQPVETWKHEMKNDFEEFVFHEFPEIGKIKEQLYQSGAMYASMSGSGSTVYGIFRRSDIVAISWPVHYMTKMIML